MQDRKITDLIGLEFDGYARLETERPNKDISQNQDGRVEWCLQWGTVQGYQRKSSKLGHAPDYLQKGTYRLHECCSWAQHQKAKEKDGLSK